MEKSTINLTDTGTINLSGGLLANVEGDGNLNVKSSSALVDGNVSGSNLTFEADHSLSKAVSGTIGNLASLNINKGASLTFDKSLQGNSFIDHVNVDGQLNVNEDMFVSNDLNLSQGTINLNGKSLNIMNGGIEMTGGVINMKDGSLDPDLTLWAAKDINISGGIINMGSYTQILILVFQQTQRRQYPHFEVCVPVLSIAKADGMLADREAVHELIRQHEGIPAVIGVAERGISLEHQPLGPDVLEPVAHFQVPRLRQRLLTGRLKRVVRKEQFAAPH